MWAGGGTKNMAAAFVYVHKPKTLVDKQAFRRFWFMPLFDKSKRGENQNQPENVFLETCFEKNISAKKKRFISKGIRYKSFFFSPNEFINKFIRRGAYL